MTSDISFDFPEISSNEEFGLFSSNNEETKNLNFVQYKNKVYKDLGAIENNIISELLANDNELISMLHNFNEADHILNSLETSLMGFKDKLSGINSEMKLLQVKSNEISIKLKNRKEFEDELFRLLDSVILAPEFLNDLTNREIEDDFIVKLANLDDKLQVFIRGELPESKAVKDIVPEMQKTLAKVCSRIYIFIVNKFQLLQKPSTNIQVIQDILLNKNKSLVQFLKKHAIVMYNDLVIKYISVMEKIYTSGTNTYISDLSQFINEKSDKVSLISSDDMPKDLISVIEKRLQIMSQMDNNSIMPMIAKQKQQKFYFEEIFRSMNKFIIDMLVTEVLFFNDFFDMDPSKSSSRLNEIFKPALNSICDFLKRACITKTNDFIAICLMIIINNEQLTFMISRKLNHLEFYFEGLSTWLWPKFDEVFKKHTDFFFKANLRSIKFASNGIHVVTLKLGEFLSLITQLCKSTTQSTMPLSRIKQIQKQFNQFYSEIVEGGRMTILEREEAVSVFFINNLFFLLNKLEGFDEILNSQDPEGFNKTFNNKIESYISILFKKYFEDINRITSACLAKSEQQSQEYTSNNPSANEYEKAELDKLSKNELKIAAANFNAKYKDLVEAARKDVFEAIKQRDNARIIFKKFLHEILVIKYFHFLEILKQSNNDDLLILSVSYQKFMIDINNIAKNL